MDVTGASMSAFVAQLKAVLPWLAEARYVWLSLAVNIFALAIAIRPGTSEPVIRLTGLVLQVLGIGTVIWGISETRALFGHPTITSKAKGWFGRFPLLKRNIIVGSAALEMTAAIGKAKAYVLHNPVPTPTVETRLAALEKNIISIHERITQTQNEMDQEFGRVSEELKGEKQLRETEDNTIHTKLEATGTGGVHISAIGASWLFVGVILSTAGVELVKLIK